MTPKNTARRACIYARVSVTKEESVSLQRTIKSCQDYASAYGWQVVEIFTDDGVSASDNRPEDRPGWQALMAHPEPYDTVIVWKVDRLARHLTDFWATYATLEKGGRSLVSVEDKLDMTTAMGRTVAGIIAGFAEQEAETISLRVAAARRHLIRKGRVVGGTVPYGWQSIKNPDGPGLVLAVDPDRIDVVREIVQRVQRGDTLYSVQQWLNDTGTTPPRLSLALRKNAALAPGETPIPTEDLPATWAYTTLERVLRHPVLAGMTSFNPGNSERTRGDEVLRDETGMPVVVEKIAIMSADAWRAMIRKLDERDSAQARPRASKGTTSALLSGLLLCGECGDVRMHRCVLQGKDRKNKRDGYRCPACLQTVTGFEDVVIEEFLTAKGEQLRWRLVEVVHEGKAAQLPEIEHALTEHTAALQATDDDEEADRLTAMIAELRQLRRDARAEAPVITFRQESTDRTFGEDWAAAEEVRDQRAVLDDALASITVTRGGVGRRSREQLLARFAFDWKDPEHIGPVPVPDETWV